MINVLIADSHPIILEGMRNALEADPEIHVVAEAGDGRETVRLCCEKKPDVAIADVAMPVLDGMDITRELARKCPKTRVLVLSPYASEEHGIRLLRNGAFGFLTKDTSVGELVGAVHKVAGGETYVSQAILERIGMRLRDSHSPGSIEELTDRQFQVLTALAEGKKTAEIAAELNLSPSTVQGYRYKLMKKLNLKTSSALVRYAIEKGLISV